MLVSWSDVPRGRRVVGVGVGDFGFEVVILVAGPGGIAPGVPVLPHQLQCGLFGERPRLAHGRSIVRHLIAALTLDGNLGIALEPVGGTSDVDIQVGIYDPGVVVFVTFSSAVSYSKEFLCTKGCFSFAFPCICAVLCTGTFTVAVLILYIIYAGVYILILMFVVPLILVTLPFIYKDKEFRRELYFYPFFILMAIGLAALVCLVLVALLSLILLFS